MIVVALIGVLVIASDTSVARVEPGTKGNGLSACEELYLARYAEAHREFGAKAVGANLVDDGTGKHEPYSLPEALTCQKADVLGNMLRPTEPEPIIRDQTTLDVGTEASTYSEPTYAPSTGAAPDVIECESGGDYGIDTGNGYYGAYQFDSQTWDAYGDPAYGEANEAPPAVQDAAAASVPYDAWPNC